MPPAPPAVKDITETGDLARAAQTRAPAPGPAGRGPRTTRARPRWARTGAGRPFSNDPLFERPDLIEDDYYRFRR